MLEGLFFIIGAVIAGLLVWVLAGRAHAKTAGDINVCRNQLTAAQTTTDQLTAQLDERKQEIATLQSNLQIERQARVTAETRLEESFKNLQDQRNLLTEAEKKLKDAFTALSTDALRHNSEAFAKQAAEKVRPLGEALKRYEEEIKQIEKARQVSYAGVTEQLKTIATTHQQLAQETSSLVHALRTPQVKGRWGELQLRRTVEVAGLSAQCDFIEQYSVDSEDGKLRPDLLVKLPGNHTIVVDSKVSTNAYLDAVGSVETDVQQKHLIRYVRAIREHIKSLSGKAYWNQFDSTPDFVVMFVPGESFFSAALEQDRSLIEDAMRSRVILASPTTLIALLRTVAYSWQQQELLENAHRIGETAQLLFERVCTFADHLGKLGDNLRRATDAYNSSVASWESRVLPMGRKISELGVSSKRDQFSELPQIDITQRSLTPPE